MIYMLYYVINMLFVFLSDCDWASCCHEWDICRPGYPWVSAALFSTDFTTFSPTVLVITLPPSGKGAPNGTTLYGGLGGPRPEIVFRALCGQKSEVSAKKRTLGSCAACVQTYLFSFQGFLPAYPSYLVTLCEANLDSFEAIPLVLGSCLIHYCTTAAGLVLMLHKVA